VESGGNTLAVGRNGECGSFQLKKIYVDDVNRIIGRKIFSYDDRWDRQKSRHIVAIYLNHYGKNKSILDKARIHNGGPRGDKLKCTEQYAAKIWRQLCR